jgi:hypothetical protein
MISRERRTNRAGRSGKLGWIRGNGTKIRRDGEDWRATSLSKASERKLRVRVQAILATRLEILLEASIGT